MPLVVLLLSSLKRVSRVPEARARSDECTGLRRDRIVRQSQMISTLPGLDIANRHLTSLGQWLGRVLLPTAMASVDGLPFLPETRPELDLGAYAEKLVETFDIATGTGGDGRSST